MLVSEYNLYTPKITSAATIIKSVGINKYDTAIIAIAKSAIKKYNAQVLAVFLIVISCSIKVSIQKPPNTILALYSILVYN